MKERRGEGWGGQGVGCHACVAQRTFVSLVEHLEAWVEMMGRCRAEAGAGAGYVARENASPRVTEPLESFCAQAMAFLAGANSIFDGDKLLTTANNDRCVRPAGCHGVESCLHGGMR